MSKVLAWGDALFVVRCERGELAIQRVCVSAEDKKVSLRPCDVKCDAALPLDARLVAANEVEDLELAVRCAVLVFLSSQKDYRATNDSRASSPSAALHSRRRPMTKAQDALAPSAIADAEMPLKKWLTVCVLDETGEKDEMRCVRLLHAETSSLVVDCGDATTEGKEDEVLQVFLVDGPHALLFERRSQRATVLQLSKAALGSNLFGLRRWNIDLDAVHGTPGDARAAVDVVSCTYVSEVHSVRPHMLIHMQELLSSCSPTGERHAWIVVDMDRDDGECASRIKELSMCHYLPTFPSIAECIGSVSKPEQISCCCFVSKLSGWNFVEAASYDTDAFTWDQGSRNRSIATDVCVPTLVITGTTSNTIYVHENGILLASYVLPSRPAEMWPLGGDNVEQHHVLCVRCDDETRSFYMLELRSKLHEASIKLLLSFKHVGFVRVSSFTSASVLPQVLLLNDVKKRSDLSEVGADESLDHNQLVKRSVLVSQTTSPSGYMLSCCRLRLREEEKARRDVRSRKRSHNNEIISHADVEAEPFCYIERTQKASSRDRSLKNFKSAIDGASRGSTASHAQLGKLASSLSARLVNGLQEMKRLQTIVSDKVSLVRRLNQLLVQLWLQLQGGYPSTERSLLMPHVSARKDDSRRPVCVEMETIVSGTTVPRAGMKVEPIKHDLGSASGDLKLEQQVSLEQFDVLEYVPSSSLFHAEVVVKNLSDIALYDSFVVMTAPNGRNVRARGGWCSSSVVPVLRLKEREARYQLQFQLASAHLRERKPFDLVLWLHWRASPDDRVSSTTPAWHPSESTSAIASVSIDLDGLFGIGGELMNTIRINCFSSHPDPIWKHGLDGRVQVYYSLPLVLSSGQLVP
ncbi:unnamed protein product [Hyaloperonospora brassicae]|uniref:Uncharacterized protein n=1 Tax=Hyaloperonospora brassicae TaxID=162125 RepID=A0AAV0U8Z1_HYABA|nr:unnamed protein product [Hyaloperonospora brassicae]